MNILIVSATEFEVKPLLDFLGIALPTIGMNNANIDFEDKDIQVLITGVGMVNTAFMVGRYTVQDFDLVLNVGVCGTFDKKIILGEVLHIVNDTLSEMGAENGNEFLTYDKLNLPGDYQFTNNLIRNFALIESLNKVSAITVNKVHGNDSSINMIKHLYQPVVESMEGAAFFAACNNRYENYTQIRAVSNYVEKRDKSKWQMPLAIKNLNDFLINFIGNEI